MHTPKNYLHDRLVLLLLSIAAFLTVAGSIFILLRIDSSKSEGYIVQYRANLGISAFKAGRSIDLLAFIVFLFITFGVHTVLSVRSYRPNRHISLVILALGILLLLMAIIASNALLVLR